MLRRVTEWGIVTVVAIIATTYGLNYLFDAWNYATFPGEDALVVLSLAVMVVCWVFYTAFLMRIFRKPKDTGGEV